MSRERRSLWGSISTSNKVNNLSLKAALLYTWAIPHFDDEGFQEGTPRYLKTTVVPYRADISLEELKNLIIEIVSADLWILFHSNSTAYIQDPVFNIRQSFKGIHKNPSKIKQIIGDTPNTVLSITPQGEVRVQEGCINKVKLNETKRSTENPISLDKEVERIKKKEKEKGHYL